MTKILDKLRSQVSKKRKVKTTRGHVDTDSMYKAIEDAHDELLDVNENAMSSLMGTRKCGGEDKDELRDLVGSLVKFHSERLGLTNVTFDIRKEDCLAEHGKDANAYAAVPKNEKHREGDYRKRVVINRKSLEEHINEPKWIEDLVVHELSHFKYGVGDEDGHTDDYIAAMLADGRDPMFCGRRLTPVTPGWKYIGPPERVTPCDKRLNKDARFSVCRDGICPGEIDGRCVFAGENIESEFEELFERA